MDRNRGLDINALRQQLEDLFEDFFPAGGSRRGSGGRGDQAQHLQVNLVESEDAYVLTAPLPGFEPDDIEINVRGQNLTLRAQRKSQSGERPNFVRHEWGLSPFHRSLELPGPVDAENAKAAFKLGVVTLTIPKAARAKSIPVEENDSSGEEQTTETDEGAAQTSETETPASGAETQGGSDTPKTNGETEANADAETQNESGRSFYMRPAQSGRRGRGGRGGSRSRGSSGETPEASEAAREGGEANGKSATEHTPEAESTEGEKTAPDVTKPESETPNREAAATEPKTTGEDPEPAQESGEEDASPVAHTTTASATASDLSDQHGPSTETEDAPDHSEGQKVTDDADAGESQTRDEPKD